MYEKRKVVVDRINSALAASGMVPCRTLGCNPGEMENDIHSNEVCNTCRAHWLLEEAKIAAQKYMEE